VFATSVKVVQTLLAVTSDVQCVVELIVLEHFSGDELVSWIILDEENIDCFSGRWH
jgi:hypothetical protein